MTSYQKVEIHVDDEDEDDDTFVHDDNQVEIETKKATCALKVLGATCLLLLVAFLKTPSNNNASNNKVLPILGEASPFTLSATMDDDIMNIPLFYDSQLVDHFDSSSSSSSSSSSHRTWSNRYYKSTKYFGGGGSPILLVVGGEGGLNHGMLYPFVTEVLAKKFNAAVLQIEHRFYGPHWPIEHPTNADLLKLLTPAQAMADMVQLTRHVRDTELVDCSPDRSSARYCPVMSIGGSYPGFLSAMFRFVHPDFVDIAYAAAAPLLMYGQARPDTVYYDIVARAADRISPGCADSVRSTLKKGTEDIDAVDRLKEAAKSVGVCSKNLPDDEIRAADDLKRALVEQVAYAFAGYNSDAYPPGPETETYKSCRFFQDSTLNEKETIKAFFQEKMEADVLEGMGCDLAWVDCDEGELAAGFGRMKCVDLHDEEDEPDEDGSNDSFMWNFQTCTNVIFLAGYGEDSLLIPMEATYEDLKAGCQKEFGPEIVPRPWELVEKWNFVDGIKDQSYILFTNGMNDMWMGGSVTWNVSDTVLALNFENGAHHSDLSHQGPTDSDTPDIQQGFRQIETILGQWLQDIRGQQ